MSIEAPAIGLKGIHPMRGISVLDRQLAEYVKPDSLRQAASLGFRGEVFFPVPCALEQNPFLLGYYRLLLGLSQKELYKKGAFDQFKYLEKRGEVPPDLVKLIPALCSSLVKMMGILIVQELPSSTSQGALFRLPELSSTRRSAGNGLEANSQTM